MCDASRATETVKFFSYYYNLQCFDSWIHCGLVRLPVREFVDDNCGMMFFCLFTWWFLIQEPTSFLTGTKGSLAASRGTERELFFFKKSSTFQKGRDIFWGPSASLTYLYPIKRTEARGVTQ